jgi:cation diffusion facilitator CzcD-associated flavoprotein CzcO
MSTHHETIIVGAGFSGLAMAIQLDRDGRDDYIILERSANLGGTWLDNSYPGCACDVPSILYSLTDEQNPRWSRLFAGQQEIWEYMYDVARRHRLLPRLRLEHELQSATWDDERQHWAVQTSQGSFTANVLVGAVGALAEPRIPQLPGLDSFEGTWFHSAQWNHDHDLRGRNVAVVGTGASSIQVVPSIQPEVSRLYLFQRTPPWVMPRKPIQISAEWQERFARSPWLLKLARGAIFSIAEANHVTFSHPRLGGLAQHVARKHIERHVLDAELRAKLTPDYRLGCKRILGSESWYPAITAPNVEVIGSALAGITPTGVIGADGERREVDTIIFATGFHVTDNPVADAVVGRHGTTLAEEWRGSPKAYFGTTVAGFPNYYHLLGPNTGLGHNSVLLMIEAQVKYIAQALDFRRHHGLASIEPRPEAQEAYVAEVDQAMGGSVWTAGGCQSWYLDETGRNSALWPGTVRSFQRRIAHFVPADNRLELPRTTREPVAA